MFKDLDELKSFLMWAKEEKISAVKVDGMEVHFNSLAFMDDITSLQEQTVEEAEARKIDPVKDDKDIDEDEDLFYSV
jgi:hypothetical protein